MATAESLSCRICSNFVSSSHCIAVFSRTSCIAERLSRVTDVPVTLNDGLSKHICRPCNRKFLSAESFRVLAKTSYEKRGTPLPRPTGVTGSPKSARGVAPRKRTKDTSGVGVSPHTHQVRPSAKRQTVGGASGRRLCFSVQDKSKINIKFQNKF